MEKQSEGLDKLSDPIAIIYFDDSTIFFEEVSEIMFDQILSECCFERGGRELFDCGVVLLCIQVTPLYLILPLL